jgi:hypothetical protein
MVHYPKYEEKLNSEFESRKLKDSKPRFGTVVSYDRNTNTIAVIMDDKYSNSIGNMYRDVPCPAINGIQSVAPNAGSRCVLGFRDNSENDAYVISFLEENSSIGKYGPSYVINTGIPKYLV